MKKLLLSSLFAACAAFGLSACNNGDYDATPLTNSGGANPLNTGGNGGGGGGGTANLTKGQIKFTAGSETYTLTGFYVDAGGTGRTITGGGASGTSVISLSVSIGNFSGVKSYDLAATGNSAAYGKGQPTATPPVSDLWVVNTNGKAGTGTVNVTEDSNNEIKGTFSFTAQQSQGTGTPEITISNGSFYIAKQ